MMRKILKLELHRGFCSRTFLAIILLGMGLSITHTVFYVLQDVAPYTEEYVQRGIYPNSLFNRWIGGEYSTIQYYLYYLLIPCLAAMAYGESLFSDIHSGYIKHMLAKVPRKEFFIARMAAVFLTGGCACIFPLLFNLLSTAMFVPAVIPEASTMFFGLGEIWMFSHLYYTHPFQYILIYLVIIFLYAGLFAVAGMCLGYYVENKASIFVIPFAVYMLSGFITSYFGKEYLSPSCFLEISQSTAVRFDVIVVEFVIGSVLLLWIYLREGKRYEIF